MYLFLPPLAEQQVIELHATPHSGIPMLRPMTFRVFHCEWVSGPLPASSGLNLAVEPANSSQVWDASGAGVNVWFGRCWYPEEKHEGDIFRWGKNGAVIHVVTSPSGRCYLSLLVDPARSCGDAGPVQIQLRDRQGKVLGEASVTGKTDSAVSAAHGGTNTRTESAH